MSTRTKIINQLLAALIFGASCVLGYAGILALGGSRGEPVTASTRTPLAQALTPTVFTGAPAPTDIAQKETVPAPAPTLAAAVPTGPTTSNRTPLPLDPVVVPGHLWLARPLEPEVGNPRAFTSYLYGTTDNFTLPVNHGLDLPNPKGIPILAVGPGVVVTAGNDQSVLCGEADQGQACGPSMGYYGNLVVIRLDVRYRDQDVFVLYGHMDRVGVKAGQRVDLGEPLGTLGEGGESNLGSHLHIEVRVSSNRFASTRNPYLWLRPLAGTGVLAGAGLDLSGLPLRGWAVEIYRADAPTEKYLTTETYQRDERPAVNADEELGENLVLGDLPVGQYLLTLKQGARTFTRPFTIIESKITFVGIGYQ